MNERVFNLLLAMLTVAWNVQIFHSCGWLTGLVFTLTMGSLVLKYLEIVGYGALKVFLIIAWALGIGLAVIFLAIGAANAA